MPFTRIQTSALRHIPVINHGIEAAPSATHALVQSTRNAHFKWLASKLQNSRLEGTREQRIENQSRSIIHKISQKEEMEVDEVSISLFQNDFKEIQHLLTKDSQGQSVGDVTAILNFCKQIIDQSGKPATLTIAPTPLSLIQDAQVQDAKRLLGIVMYYANKDNRFLLSIIDPKDYKASCKKLADTFINEMKELNANFNAQVTQEAEHSQLFDPELVRAFHLPIEFAKIMTTCNGFLNLGISELLQTIFFDSKKQHSYQEVMSQALKNLESKPSLRQLFDKVEKPCNPQYGSNTLIRSMLNLDPTAEITDLQAKQVALATFISKLRQGPIGSCFATSVGINIQILRPDKFIEDIASLLKNDSLERTVDGEKKRIQYVLDATNDALSSQFTLTSTLTYSTGVKISSSWALHCACKQMGIADAEITKAIEDAASAITKGKKSKTTALQIIEKIALLKFPKEAATRADIGKIGFCAIDNNLILRAWEEVIAAMAELRPHGLVHGNILQCVTAALQTPLKPKTITDKKVNSVFQSRLLEVINKNLDLRYDPSTTLDDESNLDKVSTDGKSNFDAAFVMYDAEGKEVQSASQFQKVIHSYVDITKTLCEKEFSANDDLTALAQTAKRIKDFVQTKQFLKLALINFDDSNKKVTNPEDNWANLDGLPWRARYGNDPFEVLDVYFEQSKPLNVTNFNPQNAQDLMVLLIDAAKKLQQDTHYLDNDIPNETWELASEQHAFEFTPEDDTMVKAVRDPRSTREWVTSYIKTYGGALSQTKLSNELRTSIIQHIEKIFDQEETKTQFRTKVSKLENHDNVDDLRHDLMNICHYVAKTNSTNRQSVEDMINKIIVKNSLSHDESISKTIKPYLVHFADTNWNDGDHNIHFCFFPYGKSVLLAQINDDGSNLQVLDQEEWVNGRQWQLSSTSLTAFA